MPKRRLEGKVALITGAAQGIGEETAIVLAREGAIVIVSDIQDEKGQNVADKIGSAACYLHLDVSNEQLSIWSRIAIKLKKETLCWSMLLQEA